MQARRFRFTSEFKVAIGNARSQSAEMVLPPRGSEGGPDNRHRGSDQWLYVVSGRGVVRINGRRHRLAEGSLLLIERGEAHEIRNTGTTVLKTLNIYVPPAYRKDGNLLPAGKG